MRKTILSIAIGTLFLLATGCATPVKDQSEADDVHNVRVTAAKKAFDDEVAKADQERLLLLTRLTSVRTEPFCFRMQMA